MRRVRARVHAQSDAVAAATRHGGARRRRPQLTGQGGRKDEEGARGGRRHAIDLSVCSPSAYVVSAPARWEAATATLAWRLRGARCALAI